MDYKDKLIIEKENKQVDVEISFGYLDRIYSVYNSKTQQKEDIEGYNVTLNLENVGINNLKNLEEIINDIKTLHKIRLSLDGIVKEGKARIAQCFSMEGVSLDLELHL